MCHESCFSFLIDNLNEHEIRDKRIVELGSRNVNGGIRKIIEHWRPKEYVGVDIEPGQGVDVICSVDDVVSRFGPRRFDLVISTEMLEHVETWQRAVSAIKNLCVEQGLLLVTTRSKGFPYHAFPYDFWRFGYEDFRHIFDDCEILTLEKDNQYPGVFLKARVPRGFEEKDLAQMELYSILTDSNTSTVSGIDKANASLAAKKAQERSKRIWAKIHSLGSWYTYRLLRFLG